MLETGWVRCTPTDIRVRRPLRLLPKGTISPQELYPVGLTADE